VRQKVIIDFYFLPHGGNELPYESNDARIFYFWETPYHFANMG